MENKAIVKHYKIPQDLLMDILRILFNNNIKHKIDGIKERENIILLSVHFSENVDKHEEAEENIKSILQDYSDYMKGLLGDNILFMDEEEDEQL
jgi:hypothetical protein